MLQAAQNVVAREINKPTDGKVLVATSVDTNFCGDECSVDAMREISENVYKYGGEVIYGYENNDEYTVLSRDVVRRAIEIDMDEELAADDCDAVLLPVGTAAEWFSIGVTLYNTSNLIGGTGVFADYITEIRELALGKIFESPSGNKYVVAGFLPDNVGKVNFHFVEFGGSAWLDVLFQNASTGKSSPIVISEGTVGEDGVIPAKVYALFPNVLAAQSYYDDKMNYCDVIDHGRGKCPSEYKFLVTNLFGLRLDGMWTAEGMVSLFHVVSLLLSVCISLLYVALFVRILKRNKERIVPCIQKRSAVFRVWLTYLGIYFVLILLLCCIAVLLGVTLSVVGSWANGEALRKVFTLAYGVVANDVVLLDWDWWVLYFVGVLLSSGLVYAGLSWLYFKKWFRNVVSVD